MENNNSNEIYEKISSLAKSLAKDSSLMTRADLAFELSDLGIENDSALVGRFVYEAYKHFGNDKDISTVFVDNSCSQTVVEQFSIAGMMDSGKMTDLFASLDRRMSKAGNSINAVEVLAEQLPEMEMAKATIDIIGRITATHGVDKVKENVNKIYASYSQMVEAYETAKCEVKNTIGDFVCLRDDIYSIYSKYAMALKDIFGDNINQIAPEMFNFDNIEWLDMESMFRNMQLDYDSLNEKCSMIMGEIMEDFKGAVKSMSQSANASPDKRIGACLVAIDFVSHHIDAYQRTAILKKELIQMKTSAKRDATIVKGDIGRLVVIYKNVHDLFVPEAELFYRYSDKVLSKELQDLLSIVYANPEVAKIRDAREQVIAENKQINLNIADNELNITYYTDCIDRNERMLAPLKSKYDEAMSEKPSKPFFYFLFKSGYNRKLYNWNKQYGEVVKTFEDITVDMNMMRQDLNQQKVQLIENKHKIEQNKLVISKLTKDIKSVIVVDADTKSGMIFHLNDIIKLLHIAKNIMNKGIDKRLEKVVTIKDIEKVELPHEYAQRINTFADSLRSTLNVSENKMADLTGKTVETEHIKSYLEKAHPDMDYDKEIRPTLQQEGLLITPDDLTQITQKTNEMIQNAVTAFQTFTDLQAAVAEHQITAAHYDAQLNALKATFSQNISQIDNKAEALRTIMAKVKTAKGDKQLKEGLLLLGGDQFKSLSEKDLDEFLKGNQSINI